MNIVAITRPVTPAETAILNDMYRLRARVFRGRLSWDVRCVDDMERDQFDDLDPTYILTLGARDEVLGCARLLPASGRTMLQEVFPQLIHGGRLNAHHGMIESSRFCVDTARCEGRGEGSLHFGTISLFAGIVEWCLANRYHEIATATDIRFERILKRAGWPLSRLGQPVTINETVSVAGILQAGEEIFQRLRPSGYRADITRSTLHVA
ncbi:GNAT family N-acetyltransferase [Rhizobium daejeonense]|uniref:Acyl-homoserine-lactone synthase n=1 Tax=Rhizobium daejeonense TaxID=240521 RepID=A0A6M1SIK0_9HYPH|nr:acyl-homoserine-lactone synthase TraI [Rhizobium daejeonense]NGO66636.1 GNAT family N-acetyltransferase [Rhizobium daejeonense]